MFWRSRGAALAALVLVAIGLFYASSIRRRHEDVPDAREATLRAQLTQMRAALEAFHRDNGRHPATLDELTPKYLPSVPIDPFTGSSKTWRLVTEDHVLPNEDFGATSTSGTVQSYVIGVHSGAGKPYADY